MLVAALSAFYARWSVKDVRKANHISQLNALLAFRAHYLELMTQNGRIAEQLKGMQGSERAFEAFDSKLREVNREIDCRPL